MAQNHNKNRKKNQGATPPYKHKDRGAVTKNDTTSAPRKGVNQFQGETAKQAT